ncbi:hypothetical protein GCM10027436_03900 [Actinophytocola sediminis]
MDMVVLRYMLVVVAMTGRLCALCAVVCRCWTDRGPGSDHACPTMESGYQLTASTANVRDVPSLW